MGLYGEKQKQIKVYYEEKEVGEYYADLVAEKNVHDFHGFCPVVPEKFS